MHDRHSSRPRSGGLTFQTVLPFALFLFFLGLWTYEVLAENPVPAEVLRLIPVEWRFWLAKGLHVVAYAFLTVLAFWMPLPRVVFWIVIVGLLLHGIGTEVGQTFTANRHGSVRDVVLDWVGVGLGLLIVAGAKAILSRRTPAPTGVPRSNRPSARRRRGESG